MNRWRLRAEKWAKGVNEKDEGSKGGRMTGDVTSRSIMSEIDN